MYFFDISKSAFWSESDNDISIRNPVVGALILAKICHKQITTASQFILLA